MPRKTTIVPVARRMPDGRLGIVERHLSTEKRLTKSEQLAQATAIMHRRLFDPKATMDQLSEEFGLCKETVRSRLALARDDGVPAQAREIFINDMLPLAMVVLQEALLGEDKKLAVTVALKINEGLKAMELPKDDKPADGAGDGDSFEIFRERIKVVRAAQSPTLSGDGPEGDRGTIEILAIPASQPARPDAEPAQDPTPTREGSGEAGVEAVS